MTNLITNAAFVGRYEIANNLDATIAAVLNNLVTTYQPVFLRQLLGPVKYAEFQTWLNLAVDARPVNAVWSFLLSGGVFEDRHSFSHYAEPVSVPLASFVYDKAKRKNASQETGLGEQKVKAQNAVAADNGDKLRDRWNELAEYVRVIFIYLNKAFENDSDWTKYVFCGLFYGYDFYYGRNHYYNENVLPEIFQHVNFLGI